MVKDFSILVEYDDANFEDVEVLDSILGDIDLNLFDDMGIKIKVHTLLNKKYSEYKKNKNN